MGWNHVHILDHLITAGGDKYDFGLHKDPGQDLGLPLVRHCLFRPAAGEGLHHMLKGRLIPEGLVEGRGSVAVHSLGTHDNHTLFLDRGLCSCHSLDGLVDVPVHRIAAVGGDNYVSRNSINLALLYKEVGTLLMGQSAVTGHRKHRLVICIYYHVDYEGQLGLLGCIEHVPVDRVVYQKPGTGMV